MTEIEDVMMRNQKLAIENQQLKESLSDIETSVKSVLQGKTEYQETRNIALLVKQKVQKAFGRSENATD